MPEFHISVLGSGSTGNVTFVSDGSVRVLLDAGLACKEIERRLRLFGVSPRHMDAVLVSHEHGDHARGAWRFCSKHRVPLYATEGTYRFMPRVPEKEVDWVRVRSGASFKLGRMTVDLFPTPHDASDPVGFRLRRGRLAFGHVTDIGHISEEVATGLRGCDARIHHLLSGFRLEHRRRRLLEQLLVAALHGALAFAQRDGVSVLVGDDLYLDVPGG